jgi:hypothetical protein
MKTFISFAFLAFLLLTISSTISTQNKLNERSSGSKTVVRKNAMKVYPEDNALRIAQR